MTYEDVHRHLQDLVISDPLKCRVQKNCFKVKLGKWQNLNLEGIYPKFSVITKKEVKIFVYSLSDNNNELKKSIINSSDTEDAEENEDELECNYGEDLLYSD